MADVPSFRVGDRVTVKPDVTEPGLRHGTVAIILNDLIIIDNRTPSGPTSCSWYPHQLQHLTPANGSSTVHTQ